MPLDAEPQPPTVLLNVPDLREREPTRRSHIYCISSPIILCWISFLEFVVMKGLYITVRIDCRTTGPKILCSVQEDQIQEVM